MVGVAERCRGQGEMGRRSKDVMKKNEKELCGDEYVPVTITISEGCFVTLPTTTTTTTCTAPPLTA